MTTRIQSALLALLALLACLPAGAGTRAEPAPILYAIGAAVEPTAEAHWREAVRRTALAHAAHEEGNHWATYEAMTGGPERKFLLLFSLDRMAEMDGWRSTRSIVIDAVGEDEGKRILRVLELDAETSDRLLTLAPSMSRPPAAGTPVTARYLRVSNVRVTPGKMTEYAALLKSVRNAHDGHDRGRAWLAYGNAIGGDRSEIFFVEPIDALAEIDERPGDREILEAAFGARKADRIAFAVASVASTTTRLWRLVPEMSRLPGSPE